MNRFRPRPVSGSAVALCRLLAPGLLLGGLLTTPLSASSLPWPVSREDLARVTAIDSAEDGRTAWAYPGEKPGDSRLVVQEAEGSERRMTTVHGAIRALLFLPGGDEILAVVHREFKRRPSTTQLQVFPLSTLKPSRLSVLPDSARGIQLWKGSDQVLVACSEELRSFLLPDFRSGPLYPLPGGNHSLVQVGERPFFLVSRRDDLVLVNLHDSHGRKDIPIREKMAARSPLRVMTLSADLRRLAGLTLEGEPVDLPVDRLELETEVAAAPEPVREPVPETEPVPQPEPASAPAAQPEGKQGPISKTEPVPQPEPASAPAAQPEGKQGPISKPETVPEQEAKTAEPSEPAQETKPVPGQVPIREPVPVSESVPEPPPVLEPDPVPEPASVSGPRKAPEPEPASETEPAPAQETESDPTPQAGKGRYQVQGALTGPAAQDVKAVVLLGPDSILKEAARVEPDGSGRWKVRSLPPGRYRVVLDGGSAHVVLSTPGFQTILIQGDRPVKTTPFQVRKVR